MALGRPRETREVFATTAPSRHPVRVERPGMQRHANSRPVCPKGSRKTSGENASPEFGKLAEPNPIPTQQSPARKVTLRRSETAEFLARFKAPNAACNPASEVALARLGMISPLLRVLLSSSGRETTSFQFSNARVMPYSLAAIQVPPAPSLGYTAVVPLRW